MQISLFELQMDTNKLKTNIFPGQTFVNFVNLFEFEKKI